MLEYGFMGSFAKIASISKLELCKEGMAFVETGTYRGDGVKEAIVRGFSTIHSIELDADLYFRASTKFATLPNIFIHNGDSSYILKELINHLNQSNKNQPIVFWLDAHFPGSDLGKIDYIEGFYQVKQRTWMPLKNELEAIFSARPPIDTIIIDDLRCFTDRYSVEAGSFTTHLSSLGQPVPSNTCRADLVGISDLDIEEMAGVNRNVSYYMDDEGYIVIRPLTQ